MVRRKSKEKYKLKTDVLAKAEAKAKAKALEAEKAVNEARIAAAAPVEEEVEEVAELTAPADEASFKRRRIKTNIFILLNSDIMYRSFFIKALN